MWTPLVHLFPAADVPVLQLSLPSRLGPERLFELGRRLAGLSADGGLVVGSGNVTHNLRAMRADGSPPEAFAAEFGNLSRRAARFERAEGGRRVPRGRRLA